MASRKKCPVCSKKSTKEYLPFCSKHCADLDLGKWLGGEYAIPAVELDGVEELVDSEAEE